MTVAVPYSAKITGSTGTTSSATITAPTTGNTLLVCAVVTDAAGAVSNFTDNQSNTYTLDHSVGSMSVSGGTGSYLFYRKSNLTGTMPTQLSCTTANSSTVYFFVVEASGLTNTSPVAGTVAKTTMTGGSSTANQTLDYTPPEASPLAFLAINTPSSVNLTAIDSGFGRILPESTPLRHHAVYLTDAGSASAHTASVTLSGASTAFSLGVYYKQDKPTVTGVSSNSATEGSTITHTVTLSGATSGDTNYAATLVGVTATGNGTDFTSDLSSATYSAGVTFSGGNMVVPAAVSSFTVTVSTTSDTTDEVDETYTLTVGGVSGTGTITDDDAPPTVSIGDATESFGTVTHTLTLSQASGKTITVQVDSANGSKTAGTHYTAIVAQTVTFLPGETEQTVTVTVL